MCCKKIYCIWVYVLGIITVNIFLEQVQGGIWEEQGSTLYDYSWDTWDDSYQEGSGAAQWGEKSTLILLLAFRLLLISLLLLNFNFKIMQSLSKIFKFQVKYRMEGLKAKTGTMYDGEAREVQHVKNVSDLVSKVSISNIAFIFMFIAFSRLTVDGRCALTFMFLLRSCTDRNGMRPRTDTYCLLMLLSWFWQ